MCNGSTGRIPERANRSECLMSRIGRKRALGKNCASSTSALPRVAGQATASGTGSQGHAWRSQGATTGASYGCYRHAMADGADLLTTTGKRPLWVLAALPSLFMLASCSKTTPEPSRTDNQASSSTTASAPALLNGDVGFTFGMSTTDFESSCKAWRGSITRSEGGITCEGLARDGEVARAISAASAVFLDGRLARLVLYSHEEASVVSARVDVRFPNCTRGRFGECVFGTSGGAADELAAIEVRDRRDFGKRGSAITIVSRRSVDEAPRSTSAAPADPAVSERAYCEKFAARMGECMPLTRDTRGSLQEEIERCISGRNVARASGSWGDAQRAEVLACFAKPTCEATNACMRGIKGK